MKNKDAAFWALAVSFIFGAALHWPAMLRLLVIALAGSVLAQIAGRICDAYQTEA